MAHSAQPRFLCADHYTGLSEKWSQGPIYCTEVTGKLVCHITGVHERFINVLPMNTEVTIHGVKVTAVDANHCPGAAMLLFEAPTGARYVHCGDFRGCPGMQQCPHLQRFVECEGVFLDTTYCHPKHVFPPQSVSVEEVARLCEEYMAQQPQRCRFYFLGIICEIQGVSRIALLLQPTRRNRATAPEHKAGSHSVTFRVDKPAVCV